LDFATEFLRTGERRPPPWLAFERRVAVRLDDLLRPRLA
jgi:hypothetical protein